MQKPFSIHTPKNTQCDRNHNYDRSRVSGLNATDKTHMYEIYATDLCVWGFRVMASIFCIGVLGDGILSLAFCPDIKQHFWKSSLVELWHIGKITRQKQRPKLLILDRLFPEVFSITKPSES